MTLPASLLPTTCDIYRPFGAGSPTTTGVPCRLVADLPGGRAAGSGPGFLNWTHVLDLDATADLRDGCTRVTGVGIVAYADGDEVRIPDASGTRYVVVWVELHNRGTPRAFKRAYLLRHAAVWPGP